MSETPVIAPEPLAPPPDRAARALAGALLALAGMALVDLVVRDRVPLVTAFVHATPPAVLAIGAGATAIAAALRGRRAASPACRRVTRAGLALLVLLVPWHLLTAWRWAARAPATGAPVRVAVWNVGRGSWGWDSVARVLRERDDDVVAVIEAGAPKPTREAALGAAFPGRAWRALDGGLAVAVRGAVLDSRVMDLDGAGRAGLTTVRVVRSGAPDVELDLVLVDIVANPLRDRSPAYAALGRILDVRPVRPRILLGDFNTPRSSIHFDAWRARGLVHAFEAAGRGCDATWPMPLPVLAIDHAWLDGAIGPRACEHVGTLASDHRLVAVEVDLDR